MRRMRWCPWAEATFALKLKNSNDNSVDLDGSLLKEVVAGIGARAMDGKSPKVGTSDNINNDDIRCRHLAGPSFWM